MGNELHVWNSKTSCFYMSTASKHSGKICDITISCPHTHFYASILCFSQYKQRLNINNHIKKIRKTVDFIVCDTIFLHILSCETCGDKTKSFVCPKTFKSQTPDS